MDNTLKYLRESLANYSENEVCQHILKKIEQSHYENEEEFVEDLDEEEMAYLDNVLENELNYAKNVQSDERVQQLTEVFELLF
ncbi:sporulation protein [Oceanobacillus salinisoli]|uniref:sporulation protein n=1 Tax=Oceanobacillus salinisoli TaxID=2678611 RepID=UPI0012E25B5A|nr:sporulation protein [Oceanobacillus salinisoli]